MQALWLQVPEDFLEDRRRRGLDKKDELWDGVLHMSPVPGNAHQRVPPRLVEALRLIAKRNGLEIFFDATGIFGSNQDWRIPDLSFVRPHQSSPRGLESAEIVVEIVSPTDESRKKFEFYSAVGVREIWIVEPDTWVVDLFSLVEGSYIQGDASYVLGVRLETANGELRVHDGATVIVV
ncbi:hypothetical protein BH11MYX1_BH11MYX1_14870 [soil metagenome]